jgi:hypothetical protein
MDYTPVTFSNKRFPHITTYGHELALSVVFESGWQHFADSRRRIAICHPRREHFFGRFRRRGMDQTWRGSLRPNGGLVLRIVPKE